MADKSRNYKLLAKLGAGSYGTAWKACLRSDPTKEFVIKRVSLVGLVRHEVADAIKEAQVLELLDHPNVLEHVEHFKDQDDHLCIVTKLADAGDVQAAVKARAKSRPPNHFPEDTIWSWFIQICCALKHVHDRKILHRDIKTANIFLNNDGQGDPIIKLGDFGIAKVLEHTKEQCKTAVGTPYYMSPELCQNREYNNKSDVWAVGCVLYELCTLKNPFDANNFSALCIKILRGKYEPLPKMYSPELSDILHLCLEQQSRKRPDMNQLLEMPAMQLRIKNGLSRLPDKILKEEFAHTVLHGFNPRQEMVTPRGSRHSPNAPPRRASSSNCKLPPPSPRGAPPRPSSRNSRDSDRGLPADIERRIAQVREQTQEILACVDALTPRGSKIGAPSPLGKPRSGGASPSSDRFQMFGNTIKLAGDSENDTRHSRIESLKLFLEKNLGDEIFLEAYRAMCGVGEEDDEQELEAQLVQIVGPKRAEYLNTICQLIFCEDRTYDQDDDDDCQDWSPPPRHPVPPRQPPPAAQRIPGTRYEGKVRC